MAAGSDEGTPARRHLVEECATLRRLLYCNNRQHRRHKTMGRLRAVLSKAELLIAAVSLAAPTGRRDGKGSGERAKLLRLARFIVVEVDFAVMRCAADLAGMLSRALYVPLALAASASVARIFGTSAVALSPTVLQVCCERAPVYSRTRVYAHATRDVIRLAALHTHKERHSLE